MPETIGNFTGNIHDNDYRSKYLANMAKAESLLQVDGREAVSLGGTWNFTTDPLRERPPLLLGGREDGGRDGEAPPDRPQPRTRDADGGPLLLEQRRFLPLPLRGDGALPADLRTRHDKEGEVLPTLRGRLIQGLCLSQWKMRRRPRRGEHALQRRGDGASRRRE